jgi:spore coat protein U-like protein
MTRWIGLALAASVFTWIGANAALADVACTPSVTGVMFAPSYTASGSGNVVSGVGGLNVTCIGGISNTSVPICIKIGAGSGGGTANVRLLPSVGTQPTYSLKINSLDLPVGTNVEVGTVEFGDNGQGSKFFRIDGSLDWAGYAGLAGTFTSTFANNDFQFGYGPTCSASSEVGGFSVTGSFEPTCAVTAGTMDFRSIPSTSASVQQATANFSVTCSNDTPYTISLGDGLFPNSGLRRMKNGNAYLGYTLYKTDCSSAWGIGDEPGSPQRKGSGASQSIGVCGKLEGYSNLPLGTYNDLVVVTITYN